MAQKIPEQAISIRAGLKRKRIGWSLAGEGWGHASRNLVFIREMQRRGYAIDIYTYDDSYHSLSVYLACHPLPFVRLIRIPGFQLPYDQKGRIQFGRLITRNLTPLVEGLRSFRSLVQRIRRLDYDLYVMDFEPVFSRAVKRARMSGPQVQVSAAMAAIAYGKLDVPKEMTKAQYMVLHSIMRHWEPRPDNVLVTTFFRPERLRSFARFMGSVVRPEIQRAKVSDRGFVLVYAKPIIERLLIPIIEEVAMRKNQRFVVYVRDPALFKPRSQNVVLKRAGLAGSFIRDFASCKAVISTGGTELASEALWLGKPLLCVMQTYQYEQYVSGHYVRKMGFGNAVVSEDLAVRHVREFLDSLPRYKVHARAAKRSVPWGFKTIPDVLESYLQ